MSKNKKTKFKKSNSGPLLLPDSEVKFTTQTKPMPANEQVMKCGKCRNSSFMVVKSGLDIVLHCVKCQEIQHNVECKLRMI